EMLGRMCAAAAQDSIKTVWTFLKKNKTPLDSDIRFSSITFGGRQLIQAEFAPVLGGIQPQGKIRESEARLHTLIENLPFDFWACDENGVFDLQNQISLLWWGYLRGKHYTEVFSSDPQKEDWDTSCRDALDGHTVVRNRDVAPGGHPGYFYEIIAPVKDGNCVHGFVGVNIDLTDLRAAQQKVEAQSILVNDLIQQSPVGIMATRIDSRNVEIINKEFTSITGYTSEDIHVGSDWWTLAYPDPSHRETMITLFDTMYIQAQAEGMTLAPIESDITCRDGTHKSILGYYSVVADFTLFFIVDITEKQKITNDLLDSRRRLEQIMRFLPDPTFAINLGGEVIYWNRAIEDLTGVSARDVIGKNNYEHSFRFYGERKEMLIDIVLEPEKKLGGRYDFVRREGDSFFTQLKTTLANGKDIYLWGKASPFYDQAGNVIGAMESIRDISISKENEEMLVESEKKYRSIFESLPLGFFRTALDGRVLEMNPACVRIFGYDAKEEIIEAMAESPSNFYANAEDRNHIMAEAVAAKGAPVQFPVKHRKKDGSFF
ncbi:MAG: PAS domain-containing protein, partial [Spirochaetota bacterium]